MPALFPGQLILAKAWDSSFPEKLLRSANGVGNRPPGYVLVVWNLIAGLPARLWGGLGALEPDSVDVKSGRKCHRKRQTSGDPVQRHELMNALVACPPKAM